jgi:chromate transporter
MIGLLIALAGIFAELSIVAFGGGNVILPEMQRQLVDVHHWLTAADFSAMFALAQAAPGPNLMIVTLLGWRIAGWPGMLVTSIAQFGPSSIITGSAVQAWQRFKDKPWRPIVQAGLVPMTVGLISSSAALITHSSDRTWSLVVITVIGAVVSFKTRLHPLWILAAGAAIGLTGIGQ